MTDLAKNRPFMGIMNVPVYDELPTPQMREIRKALDSPMVNAMDPGDLYEELKKYYGNLHLDLRRELPEPSEIEYNITMVVKYLHSKRFNIRIAEIEIAWSNGILEEYGKWFGLSKVELCKFISAYLGTTDRKEAVRQKLLPPPEVKKVPSPEEQYQTAKINVLNAYKLFLDGTKTMDDGSTLFGSVDHFGGPVFDFLHEIRLFTVSQADIDEIYKVGQEHYMRFLKTKHASQTDPLRKKEAEKGVNEFISLIQHQMRNPEAPKELPPLAVSFGKRYWVDQIFTGYVMEQLTPDHVGNLIDEAKK